MKSHFWPITLLGILALTGLNKASQAAPTFISTGQGRGADLAIRGGAGFATSKFGSLDILRIRNSKDLGGSRKIYLRFDLATLPASIKTATGVALGLRMTPAEGKSPANKVWTFNVAGLQDGTPGENWEEKGATWNDAPANDATSPLSLTNVAVPLGTFTVTGAGTDGQVVSFSSPKLLEFLQQDTNGQATLIITRQEQGDGEGQDVTHIFASREHKTPEPPVLSIAFNNEAATLPTAAQWATLPVGVIPLPFESDIEAFEAADRKNPPAKGGVVFVGSSSIRLWTTLATDFPGLNTLNRGFGGSHVIDSVHFAQRIVTPYEPKMIVFYAGTNDLGDNKTGETIFADYKAFVAQVRAKLPTTPIAYISISPTPARWSKVEEMKKANGLIAAYCKTQPNLQFIDIFPLMLDAKGQPRPELYVADQLHMNPSGYAIWAKAVAPYLPKP